MAGTVGHGGGVSTEGSSSVQLCESDEAVTEWRSSEQLETATPSTSPSYWDIDDEDDTGPKPSDLYGKYTWKIDKFPQINKRELRSNAFEVGGYKWYILIYPQGCDVCNHLSLFLCVANHDKLLPGWSHFAQFTISVVHKEHKKSKYSDTLHRFWKKEHDWGWKKFMELSKVSDGFLEDDTLVIKAQVQVIRENVNRPFRCLECNYRGELVRVYLTNIEQVCRRFVEERRTKLVKLIEDEARWTRELEKEMNSLDFGGRFSFCTFWRQNEESARQRMSREKTDIILKMVVKHFFIEKEVTSTLVMDSLYSGLKALEAQSSYKKHSVKALLLDETPAPIVRVEKDMFVLVDDVLPLLERAAMEPLPPKDEKGPQNRTKEGASGDDFSNDNIERDERRLTELGRRTVEIFILAHIFSNKIEVAYQEAVALRRQEDLIKEEAESKQKRKPKLSSEKDKKSKKKQAKQKKSNLKAKDKFRDEKLSRGLDTEQNEADEMNELVTDAALPVDGKPDELGEKSDISDSVEFVCGEAQDSDFEDRDASLINWDTDTSDNHPPSESHGGTFSIPNGKNNIKSPPRMDDSSSTCSTDSAPSVVVNSFHKVNTFPQFKDTSPGRHRKMDLKQKVDIPDEPCSLDGVTNPSAEPVTDTGCLNNDEENCKAVGRAPLESGLLCQDNKNLPVQQPVKKFVVSPQNNKSVKEKFTVAPSSAPLSLPNSSFQIKSVVQKNSVVDPNVRRKIFLLVPSTNGPSVSSVSALPSQDTSRPERHPNTAPKPTEKSVVHQVPHLSRPSSAPIYPANLPVAPTGSSVKAAPQLARSISVAGRLGPETLSSSAHSFIPQSYRNVMMGNTESASSASVSSSPAYMNPSVAASSSTAMTSSHLSMDHSAVSSGFTFCGATAPIVFNNGNQWMDSSPRGTITRNTYAEPWSLTGEMQNLNLHSFLRSTGSSEYIPAEFTQPRRRQVQRLPADDFPHIDIINDLLDDELAMRNTASSSGSFNSFINSNGNNQLSNRQLLSFPSSPRLSHDDDGGLHRSYNSYSNINSHNDPSRDLLHQQINAMNFQSQWQLHNSGSQSRLSEGDGYLYSMPEYSNSMGGLNGYGMFRPANDR